MNRPPGSPRLSSPSPLPRLSPPPLPPPPPVPWEVLGQETLYEDRWRVLRRDRLRLQSGQESSYVYLQTAAAVFVVPQLTDGRVALLRQYRHPLRAWIWEVPAGGLEADETAEAAGARELAEEIGGRATVWRRLGIFPTVVAHATDSTTYLLAQGVTLGERCPEPHELAEVHVFWPEEALLLARGSYEAQVAQAVQIAQAKHQGPEPAHEPGLGTGHEQPMSAHSALALLLAEPLLR